MFYSLSVDLYEITMAYGYWKLGKHNQEAVFNLFYRKAPFGGNCVIAAGLETVIKYIQNFKITESDIAYLMSLKGNDGKELFPDHSFFDYLCSPLECYIKAVPEGTIVYPNEPLLTVRGPLAQCQLLETPLLTIINYQTLIATKAKRICDAAKGKPVLEFGLRRAHGFDGGLSASRAAYIGGCTGTSNVLAGKEFGIPIKGTMAHSWVMSFNSEIEAFENYAEVMPNNVTLLIDTYDTIDGAFQATVKDKFGSSIVKALSGVRLDSGDLCGLSKAVRKILDNQGSSDTKIVASNDLDEYSIAKLEKNGAKIDVYGVGTKLVTAYDQPALGGVYKLGAIKEDGKWIYKIKHSEDSAKTTNPGLLNVWRCYGGPADTLFNELDGSMDGHEKLLIDIFDNGKLVYGLPSINDIRQKVLSVHMSNEKITININKSLESIKKGLLK